MTHLTDGELVDVAEGRATSVQAEHLAVCGRCRADAGELRGTLLATRDAEVEVREPSPLFWEHFSAAVRARVASEPASRARAWSVWRAVLAPRWAVPVTAAAVVALAVVAVLIGPGDRASGPVGGPAEPIGAIAASRPGETDDGASELDLASDGAGAEWTLLVLVTDGMTWDDAGEAGLNVGPGSVDGALDELSTDERRRLAALLEAELDTQS